MFELPRPQFIELYGKDAGKLFEQCFSCEGSGNLSDTEYETGFCMSHRICPECKGSGWVKKT